MEFTHRLFQFLIAIAAIVNAVVSAPATNMVRLLSQQSGRFVRVVENGTLVATGNKNTASVFVMYLKNSQIQFELKSAPGMFLMLKDLNPFDEDDVTNATSSPKNSTSHEYALVVDYPASPFLTKWKVGGPCGALTQNVDEETRCFITFSSNGKVAGPCGSIPSEPAACGTTVLPAS